MSSGHGVASRLGEIFAYLFNIGADVLSTTVDSATGTITGQLGDVTKDSPDSDRAEFWYGVSGLVSRPSLASQGQAGCQVLAIRRGDRDIIFGYRDLRYAKINSDLEPGDGCLFGTGSEISETNGRFVARADGSFEVRSTAGIDLGGNSSDAIALASKVNQMGTALKTFAQDIGAVAVNPETGDVSGATWATVVLAANNLASAIENVASALVKAT
jgi:hypothetical protein